MGFVLGMWELPRGGKCIIANIRNKDKDKGAAATEMLKWFSQIERDKENIPENLSLLLKMLARNPSKRPTSSDLVKSLRALPQVKNLTSELLL